MYLWQQWSMDGGPWGVLGANLHIGEVHTVQVTQHLVDLRRVLQDCPCCLGQVIEGRIPSQGLRKCTGRRHLQGAPLWGIRMGRVGYLYIVLACISHVTSTVCLFSSNALAWPVNVGR